MTTVEQAAREASEVFIEKWKEKRREASRGYRAESVNVLRLGLEAGYLAGHAAARAESETEIVAKDQEIAKALATYDASCAEYGAWEKKLLAEIAALRAKLSEAEAKLTEAKSAIRWMHGYDEPGTEAFPICPDGKRYAWRGVSRQQSAIVREACMEQLYPTLPDSEP